MVDKADKGGGIQSVDLALEILTEMGRCSGPVSLSELARRCGIPPSKAHRYLASFTTAGFVSQAGRSGKYDLGPAALRIGLSALVRHDFVNRAADALPDLRDATGMTALLSIWGTEGATVVRWERAPSPVITSMGLGTTLPLLTSASGRVFLTWAPEAVIRHRLAAETAMIRKGAAIAPDLPSLAALDDLRARIRAAGYAAVDGRFIPGLVAIAAPVLDWQGEVQCVATLIGTDPGAVAPDAAPVRQLLDFARLQSIGMPAGSTT